MIWAVLDTNTLVSGFGWPETIPGRIIDHLLEGRFIVVMTGHSSTSSRGFSLTRSYRRSSKTP